MAIFSEKAMINAVSIACTVKRSRLKSLQYCSVDKRQKQRRKEQMSPKRSYILKLLTIQQMYLGFFSMSAIFKVNV